MTSSRSESRDAAFAAAMANAERFFMGDANVQHAMRALARALEAEKIPYAIAGAMALNAHGYERVTRDVDVLLTADGLARAKAALLGRGYLEKFPGSNGLRDTAYDVGIDVLLTGAYPGDGVVKPVAFPDPEGASVVINDAHVLRLPILVDLKLASGISAAHRLKDLADVLELIRATKLPLELVDELSPYVQAKYRELWHAAQTPDAMPE